jgi:hypothetical protein
VASVADQALRQPDELHRQCIDETVEIGRGEGRDGRLSSAECDVIVARRARGVTRSRTNGNNIRLQRPAIEYRRPI